MTDGKNKNYLKILREWWDNITSGFQTTFVGKVLAVVNVFNI